MKKIIVMPPTQSEPKKLKVAAYCRVSTLSPTQRCSFDWQIKSYTKMITEHPDWILPVSGEDSEWIVALSNEIKNHWDDIYINSIRSNMKKYELIRKNYVKMPR